jgi:hypothetical protein
MKGMEIAWEDYAQDIERIAELEAENERIIAVSEEENNALARRVAELEAEKEAAINGGNFWKAEHIAGNQRIAELEAELEAKMKAASRALATMQEAVDKAETERDELLERLANRSHSREARYDNDDARLDQQERDRE